MIRVEKETDLKTLAAGRKPAPAPKPQPTAAAPTPAPKGMVLPADKETRDLLVTMAKETKAMQALLVKEQARSASLEKQVAAAKAAKPAPPAPAPVQPAARRIPELPRALLLPMAAPRLIAPKPLPTAPKPPPVPPAAKPAPQGPIVATVSRDRKYRLSDVSITGATTLQAGVTRDMQDRISELTITKGGKRYRAIVGRDRKKRIDTITLHPTTP